MARNSNTAVFVALVAALVISTASAVTHQVGDGLGWNVLPSGAVAYSTWSSNNTFKAGDTLVFTFTSGSHDVAEVTKVFWPTSSAGGDEGTKVKRLRAGVPPRGRGKRTMRVLTSNQAKESSGVTLRTRKYLRA
ncbi:hypothetical protein ACLB2K_005070 [Fragaria x ananassa]